MKLKAKHIALVIIACMALLSGCRLAQQPGEALPLSSAAPKQKPMSSEAYSSFEAKLYFVKAGVMEQGGQPGQPDFAALISEEREVQIFPGESRAGAALREFMAGSTQRDLLVPPFARIQNDSSGNFPKLQGLEISGDCANVKLDYGYRMVEEKEWLATRFAIARTVMDADPSIEHVNVYRDGVEPGYMGRPLGPAEKSDETLEIQIAKLTQLYNGTYQMEYPLPGGITRPATLYFADSSDKYLIAQTRSITVEDALNPSAHVRALMEELLKGPTGDLQPVFPYDLRVTTAPAFAGTQARPGSADEEVSIYFSAPAQEFNKELLCGAITATVTGFYPSIETVKVYFDTQQVTLSGAERGFKRSMFDALIGTAVPLNLPDEGTLMLSRAVGTLPSSDACDPLKRVELLFANSQHPFTVDDVQDVYLAGSTAVVSFAPGFADKLGAFSDEKGEVQERLFIYSIVNTLSEMTGISNVWLLEGGERILAGGRLSLQNALLRNPGIILGE